MSNSIRATLVKLGAMVCAPLLASLLLVGEASALPSLRFTFNGFTTVVADNQAGDTSSGVGVIAFAQNFLDGVGNNFNVTNSQFLSWPTMGSVSAPRIGFTLTAQSSSGGTLSISFTETGFNSLDAGLDSFQTNWTVNGLVGNFDGTATISSFLDSSDTPFGMTTALGSAISAPGALSGLFASGNLPGAFPYSLTQVITLTLLPGNGGATLGTGLEAAALVTTVPEPDTLALLGLSLAGLGFALRKRAS